MPFGEGTPEILERIGREVVDAAYHVHKTLGAGLLESVYEECLVIELRARGLHVERQVQVPIYYREQRVPHTLRLDLIVEGCVIIEVKAVEETGRIHVAQLMTYLKLAKCRLGYVINFNVPRIKEGIDRVIL